MTTAPEPVADRAYRMIRADIMSGTLAGGSRIAETYLAERYGFSRTPVREALRRLQSQGLVEVSPHRGARVLDWRTLDISTIYDMRALVEGFLVRRAAMVMDEAEIDRLEDLCHKMEQDVSSLQLGSEEFVDCTNDFNQEFHGAIATAAGGEFFAAIRSSVLVAPLVLRMVYDYTVDDQARSSRHHREILAAIRARNPEWAESVMLAHVYAAKSRLLQARDASGDPQQATEVS